MAPAKKKPPVTGYRQASDKGRPTQSTPQKRPTSAMPGPRPQSSTRTASASNPASTPSPRIKVPAEFNAKTMTSAKPKPRPGTIPANRKPAAKPAAKPAITPSPRIKVPAEFNARTIYSGANKPRPGSPTTIEGRIAARGPLNPEKGPSIQPNSERKGYSLTRGAVAEFRAKTADVRPSNKPVAKPTAKPTAPKPAAKPATTTPRVRTTTSYGPPSSKVKFAGSSQSNPLSGIRNAATNAVNTVKNTASQVSKSGVGKNLTRLSNNPAAKVLGRTAVVGGIVSELNQNLNPNSAMNKRDAELLRRINKPSKYGPRFKNAGTGAYAAKGAKPAAGTSRFAGARDKAMAKAKAIKGSPVLGPKKVGSGGGKLGTIAQAFDKSFASARKASKATFMFRGKKYTTEMA